MSRARPIRRRGRVLDGSLPCGACRTRGTPAGGIVPAAVGTSFAPVAVAGWRVASFPRGRESLVARRGRVVAGCGSSQPKNEAPSHQRVNAAFKGSPAPLASLHDQANQLLGGGPTAFEQRIASLKGYPVVVNKWASWCGPCQTEFPVFQRAAVAFGRKVAFMGIDGKDQNPAAASFLRKFPVTYPSYTDPKEAIARKIHAATYFPQTIYYDRNGHDRVRPRRSLRERRRAREGHPTLRARMTGTVLYEVRRVRGQQEMAAALRAAPRRVLRRAGRARARGARRPRPRGHPPGRRARTASCWPPAGCCSSGRPRSSAGWPCGGRPAGAGSPPRCWTLADERDAGRRGAPDRAARPDLRPRAVRDRPATAPGPGVPGGGDRAHRDGEAPLTAAAGSRGTYA